MTVSSGQKYQPEEILVLAPHCLQRVDCPYKISIDVHNCHRWRSVWMVCCALPRKPACALPWPAASSRNFAQEYQPKAIVAIACERDLTSGIKDMHMQHIPVVGVK